MFAVHRHLHMTLYDPALCLDRWLLSTCRDTQQLFQISNKKQETVSQSSTRILSQQQRYRKASKEVSEIPILMAEVGTAEFHARLEVLHKLKNGWHTHRETVLHRLATMNVAYI